MRKWPTTQSKAREIIRNAEAELGHLTDGQRRDLLKDNLQPPRSPDEIAQLVHLISKESHNA